MTSLKLLCTATIGICLNVFAAMPACGATLSTNAAWTWMKGATNINQNGIYGTQGVPAPTNTPGARYAAVSWTDAASALWLFGGEGYPASGTNGLLNDLWRFDPATTNWTWVKGANIINQHGTYGTQGVPAPTNTPGARYAAVSRTDAAGALWLFGGEGYPASESSDLLNDLWRFDPTTTNWTWMKGTNIVNQNGIYGTQGVPAVANMPGARYIAVSWMDGAGALWLFGGYGQPASGFSDFLNDLWRFDPATTNWTWIKGTNIINQHGTYGTQGVPAAANTPGARFGMVSWTDAAGALWLFGGEGYPASGSSDLLNDLWRYDPATTNWTWMKGTNIVNQNGIYGTQGVPAPTNTPGARSGATSWTGADGALWLFGGYGRDVLGTVGWLNDLWRFDPVTTNWTWISGADFVNDSARLYFGTDQGYVYGWEWNRPGAGSKASSWEIPRTGFPYDVSSDTLWLFGGYGYPASQSPGALNALWKYGAFGGGISLDTNALVFSATYQGTNPVAQMIAMTNVGVSAFTYTNIITYSTGGSGWLRVLPADGTLAVSNATVLTNYVNISGLGDGTYYATNQVTARYATNSPQSVVVTLIIVPGVRCASADYDGDGKADPAVYEEAPGTWKMRLSSVNYYLLITTLNGFGGPGYASVPADYDGDRKADPAVYNEATGIWIILPSSLGYAVPIVMGQTLGGLGYSGMQADYDGDRLADPGVYQRERGDWKVLLSSANYSAIELPGLLGGTDYRAVAADYDGDHKADPAIYGENNGYWIFKLSSIGYVEIALTQTLGGTGYIPVPADYDGDGLADPAVKLENGNEWIVMFSSGNYTPVHLTIPFE